MIYINDLSDDLSSNPKLFADDTSIFPVVHAKNTSANELNNDLRKISNWAYQWKMSFNPNPLKQAQEVIFSRKMTKTNHPALIFNKNPVHQVALHKHLRMYLDCKLNFEEHLKTIINKIIKTIGLLRKFQSFLPRKSLLTIYKSFIRPHFDYGDIIYDQTYNTSFHQRFKSLQYNAALAITDAIRGTLKEKLYNKLGLESLQNRRWYRNLSFLYKVIANQSPSYLFKMIPKKNMPRPTRGSDNISLLGTKHNFFQNRYFPSSIKEWNRLDIEIRKSDSNSIFKKRILSFIRPLPNKVSKSHNPQGLKLLTRLRLGLSHLRYHNIKHNFLDTINPLCSCGSDIETALHFPLYCPNFTQYRNTLLSEISEINSELITSNDLALTETLLFGDNSFIQYDNSRILDATIAFIVASKRFDDLLLVW